MHNLYDPSTDTVEVVAITSNFDADSGAETCTADLQVRGPAAEDKGVTTVTLRSDWVGDLHVGKIF